MTALVTTIKVLDHGLVELIDSMGDDLAIVNAAQASFDRESEEYTNRESMILRFLMKEEHGVPFEHVVLKFRLRMPIFVARQYVKHRVASWSEHSARYSPMEPLFYVPDAEHVRSQVGKPGSYTFQPLDPKVADLFRKSVQSANYLSWNAYDAAIQMGVAKEVARMVLPVNLYTTVVWTLNARSLFNVLRLRADSHAQYEARVYAEAVETFARTVIPDTIDAFVAAGRPKP